MFGARVTMDHDIAPAAARSLLHKTSAFAIVVALGLTSAACGGGGERPGSAGPPAPAPAPPAPPPPPPPAPEVRPFASRAGDEYSAVGTVIVSKVSYTTDDQNRPKLTSIDPPHFIGIPGEEGIGITYLGPNSYVFNFNGFGGPGFGPQSLHDSTAEFDRYVMPVSDGFTSILELAKPGVGVDLTYASFGNLTETLSGSSSSSDAFITYFAVGSVTPEAQVPTTGSASYSGIADGLWFDGGTIRRLYGSSASLSANFATGAITSTLVLRGHDNALGDFTSGPTTSLGTFTGTGRISEWSSAHFDGSYAPSAGYSGGFAGNFYGPSAEEYGLSFQLTGPEGSSAFGVAVGAED